MKKFKLKQVKQLISIAFSVLFAIVLFNTIFFNRTVAISFSIRVMIIGTLLLYFVIYIIYKIYKNKNFNFLDYEPKKTDIICILLITFIIQYIFARLNYASCGWDCGHVIFNAQKLLNEGILHEPSYFAAYSNNIGLLLLFKYTLVISNLFVGIADSADIYLSTIVLNIIMVDIAALFTFLTIKKVLGNKSAYFSLIFIIPLIILSPYILIPYTDTLTMVFPIMFLYLYMTIKELKRKSIKKYILMLLEGIIITVGILLKPTVIIMLIAIVIIELLNIKIQKIDNKKIIKNFIYLTIVTVLFITGCGVTYMMFSNFKQKNLGSIISQEDYNNASVPYTHFLMMGMQEREVGVKPNGEKQMFYGGFNAPDVLNTNAIKGYKEKKEYNLSIIKERLKNFGIIGYSKFLYNKLNWILSDGTFFYGQEGNWRTSEYYNQSKIAKLTQKLIDPNTVEFKKITANLMQIFWILITLGLIFSINKTENNYISIGKLSIFGLILFTLLFEGRSRYLINYMPIFIFIATYGLTNILKSCYKINKKLLTKYKKINK